MYLKTKPAALAMAGAAALLVLTGAPALAAIQTAGQASTAPEIATGTLHGKPAAADLPVVSLSWQGLVNTHGTFVLTSQPPKKGQKSTFTTAAGKLVLVTTTPPRETETVNPRTCHFWGTNTVVFAAVPGHSTGKFAGVTGPAAVKVYYAGYEPRYKSGAEKGQCDNNAELSKGAVLSFLLSAVLTTHSG